ncbi:MAG: hypothetical protein JWO46_3066, partial [Nocardioidaceae bacterium]|nr:hypothetical protein [Nocardioidaceae bacterium]
GSRIDLGDLLLGGGLVLAGVVTALTSRRGLFGTPGEQEGALRLAANPVRSDLLDRALRVLSEVRLGQNLPMPDVSVVYLSDDKVILHVVGTPEAPSHPWRAAEDRASWSVTAADLDETAGNAPAPYPALVNVAESHGYDVLVDLEYASGLVAVGGDLSLAREVVMSSVVDLATHAWSDAVEVTMVGFGDELAELAPGRIRAVSDVDTALDEIEEGLGAASQLLGRLGVDGVLSGRATARHDELKPRVLVLSAAPTSVQLQRISSLSGNGRTSFAAISVGDALGARWRFVVDQNGTVDLGVLGVTGTARRFTLSANQEIRTLVEELVKDSADRASAVAHSTPSTFVSPDLGPRAVREKLPDAETAAIRVQLLGPVAVTSAATGKGPARDIVSELVVMAVLHPHGLHEAVIRSSLWPRGVTDDVVESTLRDTQIWLGVDAAGKHRFAQGDDGLWQLGADVYVDWTALQACALPDGGSEAAAYLRGLQLAQGPAFSGTPAGRYSWLAWHRSARDARALAVTMASRAATLLASDPKRAEQALRAGLELVPGAESLWRELIRLHGDDRPHGPTGIVAEMRSQLPGQAFEAETEALVAHLAPGESLSRTTA